MVKPSALLSVFLMSLTPAFALDYSAKDSSRPKTFQLISSVMDTHKSDIAIPATTVLCADETMSSDWKIWHKRVSETLFDYFRKIARKELSKTDLINGKAVFTVNFKVDRNQKISEIQVFQKFSHEKFNLTLLKALKMLDGNLILMFPKQSDVQIVSKNATWDYSSNCAYETIGQKQSFGTCQ